MKKLSARILALVLVLLMIVPMVMACGDDPKESETETETKAPEATAGPNETESETETEIETEPDPDAIYRNDPENYLVQYRPEATETITFHSRDQGIGNDYTADQGSGEILDAAIFARNVLIETHLNVMLEFIESDKNKEYYEKFVNDYDAETAEYDILCGRAQDVANLCWRGYVEDLNDYGEIFNNFETSWWNEKAMSELEVNDKLFFVSGDMSLSFLWGMGVTHVNLELAADYQITKEELYAHVKNYTWTVDTLYNYVKDIYEDLNEDGQRGKEDLYGFTVNASNAESLRVAGNFRIFGRDVEGKVALHETYFSEEMVSYMQKLWNFNQSKGWFSFTGTKISTSDGRKIYTQGRSVFQPNRVYTCTKDGISHNFTLLPNPMYDAEQKEYYTFLTHDFSVFSISKKATNKELSAATIEYYELMGYETTTPVLFETIFKVKLAEDAETAMVFDITKSGVVIELGRLSKYFADSDITEYFCDTICEDVFDVTYWNAAKQMVVGDLQRINEAYGFVYN